MKVSGELQNKYDNQYSDNSEEWREKGAKGKVQNIFDVTKGLEFSNVVEVGAGDGNVLLELSKREFAKEFTASEISKSAIKQIKKKDIKNLVEVKAIEGYTLPFADNQFDLAICSHVIEHVEFPRALLRELKRISKKQVLEVPIDFSFSIDDKFDHYYDYGHINIYTPALFKFLLKTENFEIINDKYAFYTNEVSDYQYAKQPMKRFQLRIKKLIWSVIPKLKRIKPHTYTALTS